MDVDGAAAANAAYDFALAVARQRGNRRATRQLEAIGLAPHLTAKQFAADRLGGSYAMGADQSLSLSVIGTLVRRVPADSARVGR
jgi:hypothetical protein